MCNFLYPFFWFIAGEIISYTGDIYNLPEEEIIQTLSLKLDPHEVRPSTSLDTLFFHIAICVGGSLIENPEIEPTLRKNFDEETYKKIGVFYCPGGFDYDKMSGKSKLMMKMFIKMLESKKNKTEEEETMIKMISGSYDISDKKYIEPIIEYIG